MTTVARKQFGLVSACKTTTTLPPPFQTTDIVILASFIFSWHHCSSAALENDKPLTDFGVEQQAQMVQDSYIKWKYSMCVRVLDVFTIDTSKSPLYLCPIPSPYYEMVTQVLDYKP